MVINSCPGLPVSHPIFLKRKKTVMREFHIQRDLVRVFRIELFYLSAKKTE